MSERGAQAVDERVAEYDLMRWVAIAAVVFIHVSATGMRPGGGGIGLVPDLNAVARFAVPAFVFIAAALAWGRRPASDPGAYGRYLVSRARVVLVPYAAFSVLYTLVALRGQGLDAQGLAKGVLVDLATADAWPHLYFVPIVVTIYVVSPVLSRLVLARPVATFLVGTGLSLATFQWALASQGFVRAWAVGLLYLPYALAGAWYARRRERSRLVPPAVWAALLAGGLAGSAPTVRAAIGSAIVAAVPGALGPALAQAAVFATVLAVLAGLAGGCRFAASLLPRLAGWAASSASLVYGVYLLHPIVVYAVLRSALRLRLEVWLGNAVVVAAGTAAVLALSLAVVWAASRVRTTAWLVGVKHSATPPTDKEI
jgi:surface polysaccharide O-acyltransferase-like enzyme